MLSPRLILSFIFGFCLHVFVLRHGEWDLAVPKLLATAGAAPFALLLGLLGRTEVDFWSALKISSSLVATSILSIYLSMLFYIAGLAARSHQEYTELHKLHQKYGDVVRIGASTLSIADPRALQAVYLNTKEARGPACLQTESMGKGASAHIESTSGRPLDAALWLNFYSFNVMGDLSLGESFGMLDNGKKHFVMETLHHFMFMLGVFGHVMWMFRIFTSLPVVSAGTTKYKAWVRKMVQKRMDNPPDVPDVFSWIIDEYMLMPTEK
ncbi:hypothetical protein VPNG_04226 [Cytospora leucostoma]|uniref:Uncharacterized protein n=1 Tax=Cytospora leucostoma TaxID=1230097 RepID=A0A423XDP8_9PEZI|nr:hypothetical protein VPNG_04226 [Cytospora leucostoma]